jgi:hypothetical protein
VFWITNWPRYIGLYHKYCAKYAEKDEDAEDHYRQAAFNYQEASELYSLDDEKHCCKSACHRD